MRLPGNFHRKHFRAVARPDAGIRAAGKQGFSGRALALCLLLLVSWPAIASAAMSPWATMDGGRMRLVALSQPRNGTITALLRIEPAQGWKTYWRDPGDAGMAPELDFSASTNLKLRSVAFPVPEIGNDAGGRFIGYHHPVSLVVEFEKPDEHAPSTIDLKALVGICDDICVPFAAQFNLALDPAVAEGEEFMALMSAQAELPQKPGPGFAVRSLLKSADGTSLIAEVALPAGGPVEAAAAASPGIRLGKKPDISVEGTSARVVIPLRHADESDDPHQVTLLVKAGPRAMETTLALD